MVVLVFIVKCAIYIYILRVVARFLSVNLLHTYTVFVLYVWHFEGIKNFLT